MIACRFVLVLDSWVWFTVVLGDFGCLDWLYGYKLRWLVFGLWLMLLVYGGWFRLLVCGLLLFMLLGL